VPETLLSDAELRERLAVYYVADPEQTDRDFLTLVDAALAGGVTSLQLRAKQMGGRAMFDLASALRDRCAAAGVLFFVNDRVDVAVAVAADGVHVGVHDLPLEETRRLIGDGMVLGYSPLNLEEAAAARGRGADYVGLGPVFGTSSKVDAQPELGLTALGEQIRAADLPAVGIGGIDEANAETVIRAGADGVAVINAIQGAADARAAAELLANVVNGAKVWGVKS
jgi:thiamine-phosphate diphosphorylase